ncbi:phosphatidylserine decarboxylase [Poriferisphaera sp. WC338]|uniref:phosphatidylserine decarboxylase n=1 Tax=Poriferisphaera sp. WC338 TaxID=3425129 RepID=UPI003D819E60
MKLSSYGRNEWLTIIAIGVILTAGVILIHWALAFPVILITLALLAFFRDPDRRIPAQRGVMVAPCDGRVSSIHEIEHFEPFDGPAVCVRIFMSVFVVHVNRCPCHGRVLSMTHTPGKHTNTLNPRSAEVNENNLIILGHPVREHPVAAVRQIAGLLARTIACGAKEGEVLQRGQRIGMIKLGSTSEVYIPKDMVEQIVVQEGQSVKGAISVIAQVSSRDTTTTDAATQDQSEPSTDNQPDTSQPESASASDTESVESQSTEQSEQTTHGEQALLF